MCFQFLDTWASNCQKIIGTRGLKFLMRTLLWQRRTLQSARSLLTLTHCIFPYFLLCFRSNLLELQELTYMDLILKSIVFETFAEEASFPKFSLEKWQSLSSCYLNDRRFLFLFMPYARIQYWLKIWENFIFSLFRFVFSDSVLV